MENKMENKMENNIRKNKNSKILIFIEIILIFFSVILIIYMIKISRNSIKPIEASIIEEKFELKEDKIEFPKEDKSKISISNGIKIKIEPVVMDDKILITKYIFEEKNKEDELEKNNKSLFEYEIKQLSFINGIKINVDRQKTEIQNGKNIIYILYNLEGIGNVSEPINLKVNIEEIGNKKGNWFFL